MKWFHFVIYFQLFVSALVGLWNGFQLLTGRIYGENTDRVYSYFSGLKGVDTIIGICYIAIAIFALVTRFMLADFKKCGPAMYIGMQVAGLIISIAYIASVTSIVDGLTEYIASSTYGTMAVSYRSNKCFLFLKYTMLQISITIETDRINYYLEDES